MKTSGTVVVIHPETHVPRQEMELLQEKYNVGPRGSASLNTGFIRINIETFGNSTRYGERTSTISWSKRSSSSGRSTTRSRRWTSTPAKIKCLFDSIRLQVLFIFQTVQETEKERACQLVKVIILIRRVDKISMVDGEIKRLFDSILTLGFDRPF